MMGLRIDLLGPPTVFRDGVEAPPPKGKKVWALLAYLVRSDAPVSRERLASLLFGDADDPLGALRWNLAELRRLLGLPDAFRGEPIRFSSSGVAIDMERVLGGSWRQAMAVETIGRTFLEGLSFPTSPTFETWLLTERRLLANAGAGVMREAAVSEIASGAPERAVRIARRLVEIDALDEAYQALLIRSLAAAGDREAARQQLQACRALFLKELGLEPGPDVMNAAEASPSKPISAVTGNASARAQLDAGEAAISAGAVDAGLQSLRRAVEEADATQDEGLQATALFALGSALIHYPRGRDEEASIILHRAISVGEANDMNSLVAGAKRELGYVEMLRARYGRARAWLEEALVSAGDDVAEVAAIRTVLGGCLSDTAHYGEAIQQLERAVALAEEADSGRQVAFASSFLGRVQLLTGVIGPARETLGRAKEAARSEGWTALIPWPASMEADCLLAAGEVDEAAEAYEHSFALGCQLGDPCWEGMAARGIGLVKAARGEIEEAIDWLDDARTRCVRTADAYLWVRAYCEDALCGVAISHAVGPAAGWVDEMEAHAARTDMREFVVRAYLHRYHLGDEQALESARLLAASVANPSLHEALFARSAEEREEPRGLLEGVDVPPP